MPNIIGNAKNGMSGTLSPKALSQELGVQYVHESKDKTDKYMTELPNRQKPTTH